MGLFNGKSYWIGEGCLGTPGLSSFWDRLPLGCFYRRAFFSLQFVVVDYAVCGTSNWDGEWLPFRVYLIDAFLILMT